MKEREEKRGGEKSRGMEGERRRGEEYMNGDDDDDGWRRMYHEGGGARMRDGLMRSGGERGGRQRR